LLYHHARSYDPAYTYDVNGNPTARLGWSLSWRVDNLPASVTVNGATESYDYDADGERLMRTEADGTPMLYCNEPPEKNRTRGALRGGQSA
jgi:YD repeat-containing protein